jgi:hypothetical protein
MSRTRTTTKSQPMAARTATGNKARIHVIYYSMYGHVATSKFRFKMNTNILNSLVISSG